MLWMMISLVLFLALIMVLAFIFIRFRSFRETNRFIEREMDRLYLTLKEIASGNFTSRFEPYAHNVEKYKKLSTMHKLQNLVDEVNAITMDPLMRYCYCGADSYLEGRACGQIMAQALDGQGQVAIIEWNDKRASTKLRRKGFEQYLQDECPGVKILGYEETEAVTDRTYKAVIDLMDRYKDLRGIYISEGITPIAAAKAVREKGKTSQIFIVTHDITEGIYQEICHGGIYGTLSQNLYSQGYEPLIHLANHFLGQAPPESTRLLSTLTGITNENVSKFWDVKKGFLLDEQTLADLTPIHEGSADKIKLIFFGEERFAIQQQIKQGVADASRILREHGIDAEWINLPGCEKEGGIMAPVEEIIAFIDRIVSEKKPSGINLKVSFESMVDFLNSLSSRGVLIATYNAEPMGIRGMFHLIHQNAEGLLNISGELSHGTSESQIAMEQINEAMNEVVQGALELQEKSGVGKKVVRAMDQGIRDVHQGVQTQTEAVAITRETSRALKQKFQVIEDQIDLLKDIRKSIVATAGDMTTMEEMSREISQIAETMDDIASRTGLLSLNAAIEAVHAKEAGKGFGVVAGEIRKLADSSAASSRKIEELIQKNQQVIRRSVESFGVSRHRVDRYIDEVQQLTQSLHQLLDEFNTAFSGVEQVTRENRDISDMMAEKAGKVTDVIGAVAAVAEVNTASSEEISATTVEIAAQAKSMAKQSVVLDEIAQSLRGMIHQFKTKEKENL